VTGAKVIPISDVREGDEISTGRERWAVAESDAEPCGSGYAVWIAEVEQKFSADAHVWVTA
jgi:hypothetical protein